LEFLIAEDSAGEFIDRLRLIALGLEGTDHFELLHGGIIELFGVEGFL
jgi:hypothetical protein